MCAGLGYEAVRGWGSRLHCLRAGISLGLDDRITQEHAAGARNYLQCGHSVESVFLSSCEGVCVCVCVCERQRERERERGRVAFFLQVEDIHLRIYI